MIDRIRIAAHRAIGRVIMPDAPQCPECGSRLLTTERLVLPNDTTLQHERCVTCGALWDIDSATWQELHPAWDYENGGKRMCRCCGQEFDDCPCIMQQIADESGRYYYCDVHIEERKVCST